MERPFRWRLFWATVALMISWLGIFFWLEFTFSYRYGDIVGLAGALMFGSVMLAIFWWLKLRNHMWLMVAGLAGWLVLYLAQPPNELTFWMSLLVFAIIILYKKLYESFLGVLWVLLTVGTYFMTVIIELTVHPPSEE